MYNLSHGSQSHQCAEQISGQLRYLNSCAQPYHGHLIMLHLISGSMRIDSQLLKQEAEYLVAIDKARFQKIVTCVNIVHFMCLSPLTQLCLSTKSCKHSTCQPLIVEFVVGGELLPEFQYYKILVGTSNLSFWLRVQYILGYLCLLF